MTDKKELPNIKALKAFRVKGKPVPVGAVISKKVFAKKSDWQNLCAMNPSPRCEETADAVGMPKAAKDEKPAKGQGGVPAA